ncbi:MAG: dynamin family protein [Sorangiineae bacterium]|nr:dynamin family protein [Polyangiaceae bacterium]MEB2322512.1 dynamin family protein [Sorangiineae bacterium]
MLQAFAEQRAEVTRALDDLVQVARDIGATALADRLGRDVVAKLAANRFHLVVVGEFNHGKTSFVNALLGEALLPVGVTPTTSVIHHLVYAAEPTAKVVLADGGEVPLPFEEVRAFAAGGARSSSEVAFLEIGVRSELLRERIVLVDTPGVNDLSLTRAEITYGYIPRADAVLFMLDAGQPVKESERQFLEEQVIGQSRDKILFVVAKTDIWTPAERDEAVAYIRERLAAVIRGPAVFPVSAHAALEGRGGESGFDALREYLTRFLAEERGRLVLTNALGEGLTARDVLARGLDARRRAAHLTTLQLDKRLELLERDLSGHAGTIEQRRLEIREQAGAIKAWARRDLDHFCDDVITQLPGLVERASGDDLRQHLGDFLEQSFRDWARRESGELATSLEQLAERMVALLREDAHDAAGRLGETMGAELSPPRIEVDTFAADVGVFAVLAVGLGVVLTNLLLGGILVAAASSLALWSRGRTDLAMRRRALELAPGALRDAAAKVAPKIDELVERFAARLDEWVVSAGQELHREIIEVLGEVRRERAASASSSEAELDRADGLGARLDAVGARLDALRRGLDQRAPERAAEPR